ncbi:D-alanyl-D-alanine carboxypeptidase [Anaerotignum lactatifermentans]|uniref:serine-type D-Ala-D-Ala carboxypeptidase n=1 Tax=Anaerotignum lactatifermentans TaxID=160404 RepID=A0ABS2G6L9_9FIRM|nr:D-alanyl-D-alanine carboxypeptidase family protein [Anaerotignum lactatifermentans]MBM6828162.1 D-alanyl-D-alanine carboxypeptidase [Anaerotignum lactatifermentans]MBM6876675.1 D-alanyl-D-alanine carboxypeptidase [Anaerotignum lactatifermentans]MBM6949745.1 D-alanyl-D-alanine carboxypeptidase [Anaerotignum lactatifermentans]
MGRKTGSIFCALLLSMICALPVSGAQESYENLADLGLSSKAALLMEEDTGTVLYEQNSHEQLPPASVTKVMTLLLIYEGERDRKFQWEDTVQVSAHAASMGGSQVYLEEGETQTAADLTKCIAIASANDAAVAMAEFLAGSEEAFVQKMNEKAAELGMEDTHFVNACGLDTEGHVTSAYDIALMSRALMKEFPEIQEYTTTWQDSITHETRKGSQEFGLTNTNKLIKWYEGATGLKTGSTGNALYCLSGTAERDGMGLIAVVMAAPDFKTRFEEVMELLDYGFAHYAVEKGRPAGYGAGYVAVEKGMEEQVEAVTAQEISVLVPKGEGAQWETKTELLPAVQAPVEAETKVGEMIYILDGEEAGRVDLVTAKAVEQIDLRTMLYRLLSLWC